MTQNVYTRIAEIEKLIAKYEDAIANEFMNGDYDEARSLQHSKRKLERDLKDYYYIKNKIETRVIKRAL